MTFHKIKISETSDILVPGAKVLVEKTYKALSSFQVPIILDVKARLVQPYTVAVKPPSYKNVKLFNPFQPENYENLIRPLKVSARDLFDLNIPSHIHDGEHYINYLISLIWSPAVCIDWWAYSRWNWNAHVPQVLPYFPSGLQAS
jgi:hypothetical protein